METKLYFNYAGLSFRVDACIVEDDVPFVEDISSVEVEAGNGDYMTVAVDLNEFMEAMQDQLNEAAEEYIRNRAIAYAEMRMDARREEGL